ncbi:MAG: hypothetical protein GOV01_03790 [Candidatus Altiarchaeota archaeon]|nr:hypothetical protein [Candidatus Altiarchaeota archaeon]
MGIQENVMAYWTIIPAVVSFTVLMSVAVNFFSSMSASQLMMDRAVKTDMIASSMSFLSIHNDSEISITWDYTPFILGIDEGYLMMLIPTGDAPVSPYPETVPITGSVERDGVNFFLGYEIGEFHFVSNGTNEVYTT